MWRGRAFLLLGAVGGRCAEVYTFLELSRNFVQYYSRDNWSWREDRTLLKAANSVHLRCMQIGFANIMIVRRISMIKHNHVRSLDCPGVKKNRCRRCPELNTYSRVIDVAYDVNEPISLPCGNRNTCSITAFANQEQRADYYFPFLWTSCYHIKLNTGGIQLQQIRGHVPEWRELLTPKWAPVRI